MRHLKNIEGPGVQATTGADFRGPAYGALARYGLFGILSLVVVIVTAILKHPAAAHFRRFIGNADPVLVAVASALVGLLCLAALKAVGGFEIIRRPFKARGLAYSGVAATGLAAVIVIADTVIRYPENTNVPAPLALAFYPAIGFVAEVVFHLLPLTLALLGLKLIGRRLGAGRATLIAILFVAVAEPTFQITFAGEALSWDDLYTWIHVFAIAFLQLQVFRRYDFLTMYAFRLIYYMYWHIIWGVIRLEVLF